MPRLTRSEKLRVESRQAKEVLIKQRSEASLWKLDRFRDVAPRVQFPCSRQRMAKGCHQSKSSATLNTTQ